MEIVDAQVHVLDPARPILELGATVPSSGRPTTSVPHIRTITGREMVAAMDAAGVDAAVIVSTAYTGWDNSYPVEVAAEHPERFRVVGRIDHESADVPAQVASWADTPGAVGLRVHLTSEARRAEMDGGGYDVLLDAVEEHDLALCLFAPDFIGAVGDLARRRPGLRIVVDHLGVPTPVAGAPVRDPWSGLPGVLALAACPNVVVKFTGAPSLSSRPFPFEDLRPVLHRYLDAFGPERLLWGTDWTRSPNPPYDQGVSYLRDASGLDAATLTELMGAAARRAFRWPAP